jgi:hypothetical protein
MREELEKILGRPVGVEKLKSGKYIAKYLDYSMRPSDLVGETEDEAFQKLLTYLKTKKAAPKEV